MDQAKERIFAVDALRGIAALIVVIWHFRLSFGAPFMNVFLPFYRGGWVVVDLFFVLSGFILTRVYCVDVVPDGYFRHFVIRRIARLYPLHLLTLLVVCVLLFVALQLTGRFILYRGYPYNDLWHFILNLFLLQQVGLQADYSFNGPSWSISTEMVASVFLITIICFVRADRRRTVCALALLSAVGAKLFLFGYPYVERMFLQTCLGFLSGSLLAFGLADVEKRRPPLHVKLSIDSRVSSPFRLPWRMPAGWPSDAIFVVCVALLVIWMLFASSLSQVNPVDRTSYVALDVIVMPMMLAAAMRSTLIAYLSATAIGRWLGAISYSVYLWHFPLIGIFSIGIYLLAIDRLTNMTEIFFLYAGTLLVVAHMSYHWFEWPARRWVIRRFDAAPPRRNDQKQALDGDAVRNRAVRPAREFIK
jgi:peptidoglycan/LPS O-acetylase OafA/YrhL